MGKTTWLASVALLPVLCFVATTSARRCPLLHAPDTANKTGCYIIVVSDDTSPEKVSEILLRVTSVAEDNKLYGLTEKVGIFFTVKLSAYSLELLRQVQEIRYIEEETMAEGTQSSSLPYHLDRVDQRLLPLNGLYNPIGDGEGVDIYVLDSGIHYEHEEFGNRAKFGGLDPMDEYLRENRRGRDCFGHGTHVASNAAGERYGAAKKATVYSVRVLDCENRGPWSTTLSGLDYVMRTIPVRGRPAVVSMSLSGSYTQSVNDAVQALYRSGVPVVVSAGNSARDACNETPASAPDVITVAGSANDDGLYFATNYGSCVDIFAPGDRIQGADFFCNDCSQSLSGTSFSAPIVSGAIAIFLQRQPKLTPDQIIDKLVSLSVPNRLDFRVIPSDFRSATPNRALFIPGSCGGEFVIGLGSVGVVQSPSFPSDYLENLVCKWVISSLPNTHIRLSFTNFSTEASYDTVELCSGRVCGAESRLATLSGEPNDISLVPYESSSNVLTFELRTDGTVGGAGFSATVTPIEIQLPPSDSTAPTTNPPTTQPITTNPPSVVTCPTVPPPLPTLNISRILRETLTQAEVLLDQAVGATLQNLLQVKLDEVEVSPTDTPGNTATPPTSATRPTLPPATTQRPPATTQRPPATTERTTTLSPDCLGCSEANPAFYCQDIVRENSRAQSGYYWVRGRLGLERVYCDMSERFINARGWMRVADIDMSDTTQSCPGSLGLIESPVRTCGRGNSAPGCSSAFFSSLGVSYSRVCGRVIGYQYSSPNAFFAHQFDPSITIDQYYVDGVSITRGTPRQHVWSFAATIDEGARDRHICPCTHSSHSLPSTALPEFVGEDYFCDSGAPTFQSGVFHAMDPLWDGEGCSPESSCCDFNTPPWFCHDLGRASTDDVELRICGNENTSNEDTPIEIVELFVQ